VSIDGELSAEESQMRASTTNKKVFMELFLALGGQNKSISL
jgi:hypothetical protein